MAPGGSVGRRSTISYDAKAAASTPPPVMDPARYIINNDSIDLLNNEHTYTIICKITIYLCFHFNTD